MKSKVQSKNVLVQALNRIRNVKSKINESERLSQANLMFVDRIIEIKHNLSRVNSEN